LARKTRFNFLAKIGMAWLKHHFIFPFRVGHELRIACLNEIAKLICERKKRLASSADFQDIAATDQV